MRFDSNRQPLDREDGATGAAGPAPTPASWPADEAPSSLALFLGPLARLLQEPQLRATLRAAGLQRAAQFSWAHTARLTLQALQAAGTAAP